MTKFSWWKAIGFGLVVWGAMYILNWFVVGTNLFSSEWIQLALAIITGAIGYGLAIYLETDNDLQPFEYGVVWLAILLGLDALLTVHVNSEIFYQWQYWLGSILLFFAPWAGRQMRKPEQLVIEPK